MLVSVLVVPNSYVRVVSSFCTYLMNLGGSTFSSGKRGGSYVALVYGSTVSSGKGGSYVAFVYVKLNKDAVFICSLF